MTNTKGKFLLAGLIGAIAGAVGGILLAPQSGEKTRNDIAKLAADILKQVRLGVVETENRVKEIYGSATKSTKDSYVAVKQAVAEKVASIKEAGESIDKDRYATIVEKVVADYKKDFEKTKNGATKMVELLKKDWEKVKKALVNQEKENSTEPETDRR